MLADSYSQPDVAIFVDKKEPPIDELAGYIPGSLLGTTGTTGTPHGAPDGSLPDARATVFDVHGRPSPRDGQPWDLVDETSSSLHGSGAFTNAVVEALGPEWGHVTKRGAQKQYGGHAIDAIAYKSPTPLYNGKFVQVVDIIGGSGARGAAPQWHPTDPPEGSTPDGELGNNGPWWRP